MSIQARIIKAFTRRTIKRDGLNEQQLVRHLRRVFNHSPTLSLIPRGVKKRDIDTNTFQGEHLATRDPQVTVLYIHGGAYIGGITRTYHNIAGRLAKHLDGDVYLDIEKLVIAVGKTRLIAFPAGSTPVLSDITAPFVFFQ